MDKNQQENSIKKSQPIKIKDKNAALRHRQKALAIALMLFVLLIFFATIARFTS